MGLTCWRTLNDYPYYKIAPSSEDKAIYKSQFSIWNFIPKIKNRSQSLIFKISISPNNQYVACLHTDGTISFWSIPTLKLIKQWKLNDQPDYNAKNPISKIKLRKSLVNLTEFYPLAIEWWSESVSIINKN